MPRVELQRIIAGPFEQAKWRGLENTAAKAVRNAGAAAHFDPVRMAHEQVQVAGIEQRVLQRHLSAALQPPLASAFIPLSHCDFNLLAARNAVEHVADTIEVAVALVEITRVMV